MKIFRDIEQGSPEWLKLRLGKVTGTRLKKLMAANNLDLVDCLISEMITEQSKEEKTSAAMQRGTEMEPLARKAYEDFAECKVEEIGFIQSDKYDWFGMSPDGLIKENGKYLKCIEIKCPDSDTHTGYIRQGTLPSDYKYQVYASFLINEDQIEHDFISYDNRFKIKPIHIVNTRREDIKEELAECEKAMEKFWKKFQKYYNLITF
jgi:putative phage-type endonuclease